MRTGIIITAVVLIVLAVPAIIRTDSAMRVRSWRRAGWEGFRVVLATAAASALLAIAARLR